MNRRAFITLVAVAVAVRLVLLATPFANIPDVYYYDTQAAHALLSGSNPYGHNYTVRAGLATQGAGNVFAYLPGVVVFLLPFGAVADVRLGLVTCDILVAFALYSLRGRWAGLTAAVYLLLPTSVLFSTWYPNDTLVGMVFLGLAFVAYSRGRYGISAAFTGLSLASSQLVWLFYPFLLLAGLKARRIKETILGLLVALVAVAPFVLWNPATFISNTVYFEFGRPVQSLLTPEPFGVNVNPTLSGLTMTLFGASVPLTLKAGVAAAMLVPLLWNASTPQRVLLNGSFFLIVAILVLPNNFSWWYLELPLMTLMVWFLSSRGPTSSPAVNP
ncbi:MAG: hypothetical protein ABR867_06140 [Nitrososphaerales archaeon]|jgi:uncharacterized membrane protein